MADLIPFAVSRNGLLVTLSAERLKAACVARGWSLSELAARARVSRPTLRSALQGHPVRPRTAWRLARALHHGETHPELASLLEAA